RKFSPKYSVNLLQQALTLANNSLGKEEINSKIGLFQKKVEKLQPEPSAGEGLNEDGCFEVVIYSILTLIIFLILGCVISVVMRALFY
ncbi:MAG: hypothetical protein J5882_02300, partial [Bacteroidales bacterium]|nr:hypothetical protein [Bacteroidales bacterium]